MHTFTEVQHQWGRVVMQLPWQGNTVLSKNTVIWRPETDGGQPRTHETLPTDSSTAEEIITNLNRSIPDDCNRTPQSLLCISRRVSLKCHRELWQSALSRRLSACWIRTVWKISADAFLSSSAHVPDRAYPLLRSQTWRWSCTWTSTGDKFPCKWPNDNRGLHSHWNGAESWWSLQTLPDRHRF